MVQISHLYTTTGKILASTIWTILGKVISLFSKTLSDFYYSFPSKEQVSFNFAVALTVDSDFAAP